MKYLSRQCLVFLLGALVFGAQLHAQDFRVGFVNTDRIFREANTAKAAQVKLEQEFAKREKDLNDLGAALKTASDKFEREAPAMSEQQRGFINNILRRLPGPSVARPPGTPVGNARAGTSRRRSRRSPARPQPPALSAAAG